MSASSGSRSPAHVQAVTAILQEAIAHDLPREALAERLVPIVYEELREIARAQRRRIDVRELQTTALVHEAYLKMEGRSLVPDRAYVFAAAAQAMRDVLVDHARRRNALKRGGGQAPLALDDLHDLADGGSLDALAARVLDLDAALQRLDDLAPRAARLVECRFFGGLSNEEAAQALGISTTTAKREWRRARAWLHRELAGGPAGDQDAEGGVSPPMPDVS
ncbi:MAG: ECF-type sigma factor [Bacteroidota bacterium]